jgi:5-methylcytosine-specific restriction endonuclease McrA
MSFETDVLADLKRIFLAHGVLGYGDPASQREIVNVSEMAKLRIVPLIFGLIPAKAIDPTRNPTTPIKPFIIQGMTELGLPIDKDLVSVIKGISDQYFNTKICPHLAKKGKFGMRDLRTRTKQYRHILSLQSGRCAVCGSEFNGSIIETLDHIIPFHLIGDVQDGSNWQILCDRCNSGKGSYITPLQSLFSTNWVYSGPHGTLHEECRYITLACGKRCNIEGCTNHPGNSKLHVIRHTDRYPFLTSNLKVVCDAHLTAI